jgi:hypothetical protein
VSPIVVFYSTRSGHGPKKLAVLVFVPDVIFREDVHSIKDVRLPGFGVLRSLWDASLLAIAYLCVRLKEGEVNAGRGQSLVSA